MPNDSKERNIYETGQSDERATIVKWLRGRAKFFLESEHHASVQTGKAIEGLAAAIERGSHRVQT